MYFNLYSCIEPTAVGEPPLCMSCACLFAVKHAVEEARAEIGQGADYFVMSEYKLGFFTS